LNIYDFFAGPGQDLNGAKGTPLIILEELSPYLNEINKKGLRINLYFNEYDSGKCNQLRQFIESYPKKSNLNIEIDSLDFVESFNKKYDSLKGSNKASLLFLDQTGIKQINPTRFQKVISVKRTDFLFFISSSTIKRFVDNPSIAKHIKLDKEEVENTPYHKIHGLVLDFYKSLIPKNKEYYLAPFSIKKNAGLYGIIFGSNNVLGIEKFLNAAWKIDPERGTANFDIDNDNIIPGQVNMFTGETQKPKKIEVFEQQLQIDIKSSKLKTDKEIYLFILNSGMKISHGRKIINKLKKEGVIYNDTLELSNKVCKKGAKITNVRLK